MPAQMKQKTAKDCWCAADSSAGKEINSISARTSESLIVELWWVVETQLDVTSVS